MIQAQESYESLPEVPATSLEAAMEGQAHAAVHTARLEYGRKLDFSAESLELLEEILILVGDNPAADLEREVRLWGSYFGEVLRRRYAGSWEMSPEPGASRSIPSVEARGVRLNPLAKVHRRLTQGEEEDLESDYQRIAARLGHPARVN